MSRAEAFAEYFRLLALEDGGVVLPDASIPVVGQMVAGMQEAVEEYLNRFGVADAWAGGARALVNDGAVALKQGPSPEEIRAGLFQSFVFRLMLDLHGVDMSDFHEAPAIAEAVDRFRLGIEDMLAGPLGETAAFVRQLMGDSVGILKCRPEEE